MKLYVGNLPYNTTDDDLRTLFSQYGAVSSVAIITDRDELDKQIERVFETAWKGRKYSIKTGMALRAFLRVVPDVLAAIKANHRDAADANAIREVIAPWAETIGDSRFETEREWRQKLAGGTSSTVDQLARELRTGLRR